MAPLNILLVDDEQELRKSIASLLPSALPAHSLKITEAETGLQAVQLTEHQEFDLVLMDVKMPEMDGLEALARIKANDPRIFVVILTAHSNLQDAVVAIKEGAYDYIEKPIQVQTLSDILQKCLEAKKLVSDLALSNPIFDDDVDSEFVGNSQKMKDVFSLIYKLTKVETTVLVRGENGTGKELVARAIHFNSPRKDGSFVAINCGAIPEALMESELFGHEKGSFTGASERKIGKFQLANNGTLFLDEIAELKPELQVKLLRVLQDKKFVPVGGNREVKTNARIIAATNRNLEHMIEEGQFREDLFYRLNVMPIFLPPLRDRKEDIPALIQTFIKKFAKAMNSEIQNISIEALQKLQEYQWPGNIRELENAIERAFIVEGSLIIQASSLPQSVLDAQTSKSAAPNLKGLDYESFKEESEKQFILNALKANQGRINQTVAKANIPKNTLLRKMKKYGITAKDGQ
jgi:DNA-binding NtrC family response regulator